MPVTAEAVDFSTSIIEGHGIRGFLPPGWSGRFSYPRADPPDISAPEIHAGNFAIALDDTGFGAQLTEDLRPGRVAVIFVEYLPDEVLRPGKGLYSPAGFPADLKLADFSRTTLQVGRPRHVGMQSFFSIGATRLGVLYVVLGARAGADAALAQTNQFLGSLEFASSATARDYRPAARAPAAPEILHVSGARIRRSGAPAEERASS